MSYGSFLIHMRRSHATLLLLAGINLLVWIAAYRAFGSMPALSAAAMLAYALGLRHAFDADHIAAIDNAIRRLLHYGKDPSAAGLYFSLGHSSVVALGCAALAVLTTQSLGLDDAIRRVGRLFGAGMSALFLLTVGIANLAVLWSVWGRLRAARQSLRPVADGEREATLPGGLLQKLARPAFRLVRSSWHLYPVGFLFGLGFDTTSEVGLLAITAKASSGGLPVASMMILPALFLAGMALMDGLVSVLSTRAYTWALGSSRRKAWYNLTMTGVTAAVAIVIGGCEAFAVLSSESGLHRRAEVRMPLIVSGLTDE